MKEQKQTAIPATTINLTTLQGQQKANAITLTEAVSLLWKHKLLLLIFAVIGALLGTFWANWVRPQYSSDALLKLDIKGNKAGRAMGEMGMLLDMASPADAEIPVIKSRKVLSYVVDAEGLCYDAIPIGFLDRLTHKEGRMSISSLNLPSDMASGWKAKIISDEEYEIITPEGKALAKGHVGKELNAPYKDDSVSILVDVMKGRAGQQFRLSVMPPLIAARKLAGQLRVAEQGKQTGVIGISYSHRYPDRAASILNTIANVYLRQNIEMRSAEAEKTLDFLRNQLPGVKAKLDSAEKRLADYRHRIGSVDMSGETQGLLKKEQDLNMQLLNLEQKRQELTRLFKGSHPSVQTIVRQIAKIQKELSKLKGRAEKMPLTQQEILSLQEEVSVNNAQYTSMLNNIQQLEVVRAGEVGTVRVIDYAAIDRSPTKPKKSRIQLCAILASLLVGIILIFIMRILKSGARNALEIERETGVSVYAKIPESSNRTLRKNKRKHARPLVCISSEDPASEALRSLFTSLEFSLSMEKPAILVAGLVAGVGKSFVSKNLAALFANSGKRTLLIDADMRRGVVFSKSNLGLADVLSGMAELESCVTESKVDNLYILGSGKALHAPTDLLHGETFAKIIEQAKSLYDVIIIDTPPINLVADTELILPIIDFALYVLHYGRHSMDQIKESINKVERLSEAPKAFVLNHCEREHDIGYHYYGYYGYKKRN